MSGISDIVEINNVVKNLVDQVVDREERLRNAVVQVGGASLQELRKKVSQGEGVFKFFTKVTLSLAISKAITAHPDGAELFAEAMIDLIKKHKPSGLSDSQIHAGIVFESEELAESIGLSLKPIDKIKVMDLVQSMEKMSQSSRSPLELNSAKITAHINYVEPLVGSGISPSPSPSPSTSGNFSSSPLPVSSQHPGNFTPSSSFSSPPLSPIPRSPSPFSFPTTSTSSLFSPAPKKNCGRKRKYDTGKLLEMIAFEKKKRETATKRANNNGGGGAFFLDAEAGDSEEDFELESENGDIDELLIGREEESASGGSPRRTETNKMRNNVSEDCLPHALHQAFCYSRYKINPTPKNLKRYKYSLRKNGDSPSRFREVFAEVEKMKKEAGVTILENFGWREIDTFQRNVFAGLFQIIVFEQNSTLPFYRGEYLGEDYVLPIYLENGHFQGIRSIPALLKTSYYCALCDARFRNSADHYNCKLIHRTCGKKCPVSPDDERIDCPSCKMSFRSETCFDNHLARGPKGGKSRCEHTKVCKRCDTAYYRNKNNRPHVCGEAYCHRCQCQKEDPHYCAMTVSEKRTKNLTRKRIFYDIESRADPVTGRQYPVLFVALKCCPTCSSDIPKDLKDYEGMVCKDCSEEGRLTVIECITEDNKEVDVAASMVNWIFQDDHKGFVAVAHNASGYDGQFILENLISSSKSAPDVCLDGTKLIYLKHKKVRLLDSMKFLAMSLASMGKAFEVDSLKGDFPVHFIRPENYGYSGPLPGNEFYAMGNKSSDAKKKLVEHLEEERAAGKQFNFYDEIVKYCFNDVFILASSMTKFEKAFEEMTNVCLLEESVTIASAAITSFRRKHLQSKFPIALDAKPSASYNSSIKSQKYLLWVAHKEKVHVKISTTSGEQKVGEYRVDGFIDKCPEYPDGQILEFNGCYYHGHSCRYTAESIIGDKTVKEIREKDEERIKKLTESYPVKIIWECDVDRELKQNEEMAKFFENTEAKELLQMQRALVGGRTEIFRVIATNSGFKVYYVDVVSLYPMVMKHKLFPIGIPINVPPSEMTVPMTTPDDVKFHGFIQCKVLAPQNLRLPLIPDKSSGKLVFGLCKACIKEHNQEECEHTEEERSFTGVYTTPELEKALSLGYKVTEVYHGIEYKFLLGNDPNGQGGLFTSYVNDNMAEKIYASGYPGHVKTDEEKKEFCKEYQEKEQIQLDPRRFEKNPGKRAVAKLMLNSLWGKFAQRVDRLQTEVVVDPLKFFKIFHDTSLEICDMHKINDTLLVQYRTREESQMSLRTNANQIASYTTSYGRLHLYEMMEIVGGENMVYCDTDSLIYTVPDGCENPLKNYMGSHLGELTSELKGEMLKFVGTGPKSYAYQELMENGEIKTLVKTKGITLNSEAEKLVTFEKMEEMVQEVLQDVEERTVVEVPQFNMRRNKNHEVFSKDVMKSFKYTFNKRRVLADGSSLPFGFKDV